MENQPCLTSSTTSLADYIGRPLRTPGCILLYCLKGCAVAECNFTKISFRRGNMAIIMSDILFSMKKISAGFKTRYFELSVALTDESTFASTGALFDWMYDNPVFMVPDDKKKDMDMWLSMMDWIDTNTTGKYRTMMQRNHWQNFFLGLETVLESKLADRDIKTISSSRRLFDGFCKLLSENCRKYHDVKFYADRLCITPYYLSKITNRIFGVSPKELIDRQIVMEIKSLLTTTELSVKEIAALYGFESTSYLGRYFRRHIGMTPSEYRERPWQGS